MDRCKALKTGSSAPPVDVGVESRPGDEARSGVISRDERGVEGGLKMWVMRGVEG